MLSCTMVLHLALVVELVVVTAILLPWCHAKILLHLVPYPNNIITNDNQPLNIVSHLVLDQVIVLKLVPGKTILLYYIGTMPKISTQTMQPIVLHLLPKTILLHLASQMQDLTLKTHGTAIVLHFVPCKHIKHIV